MDNKESKLDLIKKGIKDTNADIIEYIKSNWYCLKHVILLYIISTIGYIVIKLYGLTDETWIITVYKSIVLIVCTVILIIINSKHDKIDGSIFNKIKNLFKRVLKMLIMLACVMSLLSTTTWCITKHHKVNLMYNDDMFKEVIMLPTIKQLSVDIDQVKALITYVLTIIDEELTGKDHEDTLKEIEDKYENYDINAIALVSRVNDMLDEDSMQEYYKSLNVDTSKKEEIVKISLKLLYELKDIRKLVTNLLYKDIKLIIMNYIALISIIYYITYIIYKVELSLSLILRRKQDDRGNSKE